MADSIRIVLVEPAGPRNLGSIARVLKNMGLSQLILVNPQCDPQDPEAMTMAVHGDDVLTQAIRVHSLSEAIQGCYRVIGTTGRNQNYPPEWVIEMPRQVLPCLGSRSAAIIFGPEDRGLTNEELSLCHHRIMIPSHVEYPSLNLAQAVGICCYELRLADLAQGEQPTLFDGRRRAKDRELQLAPIEVMEGFYDHLEQLLLKIEYLQHHTAKRKMEKFRTLFNRAQLTLQEVAQLRGILRKMGLTYDMRSLGPKDPKIVKKK